jgi:hypothetical protein
MSELQTDIAALLESLAKLFETRALIAARNFRRAESTQELGRKQAYEEAAHEARLLARKLSQ